jgi:hypothetical protein
MTSTPSLTNPSSRNPLWWDYDHKYTRLIETINHKCVLRCGVQRIRRSTNRHRRQSSQQSCSQLKRLCPLHTPAVDNHKIKIYRPNSRQVFCRLGVNKNKFHPLALEKSWLVQQPHDWSGAKMTILNKSGLTWNVLSSLIEYSVPCPCQLLGA